MIGQTCPAVGSWDINRLGKLTARMCPDIEKLTADTSALQVCEVLSNPGLSRLKMFNNIVRGRRNSITRITKSVDNFSSVLSCG